MSDNIETYLSDIMEAVYGEQVRSSIYNAIRECYSDVSNAETIAEEAANDANEAASTASQAADRAGSASELIENAANLSKYNNGTICVTDWSNVGRYEVTTGVGTTVGGYGDDQSNETIWHPGETWDITNVAKNVTVDAQTKIRRAYLPCSEGQTIRLWVYGGDTGRAWCFADLNGVILDISGKNVRSKQVLVAPAGAAWLIVHTSSTAGVIPSLADAYALVENNDSPRQATNGLIAKQYDSSSQWTAGDFCIRGDKLYLCTENTIGDWDSTKWTNNLKSISAYIKEARQRIDEINSTLSAVLKEPWAYFYNKYFVTNHSGQTIQINANHYIFAPTETASVQRVQVISGKTYRSYVASLASFSPLETELVPTTAFASGKIGISFYREYSKADDEDATIKSRYARIAYFFYKKVNSSLSRISYGQLFENYSEYNHAEIDIPNDAEFVVIGVYYSGLAANGTNEAYIKIS